MIGWMNWEVGCLGNAQNVEADWLLRSPKDIKNEN